MNLPWFKRVGIVFIPITFIGWVIFASGLGFAVYKFIEIDSKSHSVSDTLMNFAFWLFITGILYSLAACITSRKYGKQG